LKFNDEEMSEFLRTACAFHTLADDRERHPETLIRGKVEDKK